MIKRIETMLHNESDSLDTTDQVKFLRLQGEFAQQRGETTQAISLCEQVLHLDPLAGKTMLLLAALQQEQGLLEDAVMTCERAARVKGHEADALVQQAQIEVVRERYAGAVALLEAAQAFRDQPHVARYLDQVRRMAE